MRKKLSILAGVIIALVASFSNVRSNSGGAPGDYSGSSSNCGSCHSSNSVNSGNGTVTIKIKNDQGVELTTNEYKAGKKYTIEVTGAKSSISTYGFCASVKEGTTVNGTLSNPSSNAQLKSSNAYVTHKSNSTATFSFDWTAPTNATKDVKLYVAYNLADGGGGSDADFIYTKTVDWKFSATSGINESNILTQSTKLLSNPVNNQVRMQFNTAINTPVVMNILSLDGKVLKSVSMPRIEQVQIVKMEINNLSNGVYIISTQTEGYVATQKMLKN
jgi:hypothetical protein